MLIPIHRLHLRLLTLNPVGFVVRGIIEESDDILDIKQNDYKSFIFSLSSFFSLVIQRAVNQQLVGGHDDIAFRKS